MGQGGALSFLIPAALGLSSLALPLIALYMLRSPRERVEVSSLLLWEPVTDSLSSSRPWQRLRITPLLLAQLAVLGAFVLSLARPFATEEARLGAHTVLVMDVSGSMGMAGRLERAREEALGWAGEMSGEQIVSVVEAGAVPRVVTAFSRRPEEVTESLKSLRLSGGEADLAQAIRLGRGLATPEHPTDLVLFTDGGQAPLAAEPVADARHLPFDETGPNWAIEAFSLERDPAGVVRALVSVANHGSVEQALEVEVAVDGQVMARPVFTPSPGDAEQAIIGIPAGPGAIVEARLVDVEDSLSLDDRSWAALAFPEATEVELGGTPSPFLAALLASVPGSAQTGEGEGPIDVSIVNRGAARLIERPSWLIRTDPPPPGLRPIELATNLAVTWQRPGEPVLDDVELAGVAVVEAQVVETDLWLPVVKSGDIPLVLLGRVDGHRVVYFTFDLAHSNLVVQTAFPLLGSKLLEWLGNETAGGVDPAPAGTPLPLLASGPTDIRVYPPSGEAVTLEGRAAYFTGTGDPGVYRVEYLDEAGEVTRTDVAIRHFAPAESVGSSRGVDTQPGAFVTDQTSVTILEWGPWVAALAASLMLLEWWLALRRPRSERAEPVPPPPLQISGMPSGGRRP